MTAYNPDHHVTNKFYNKIAPVFYRTDAPGYVQAVIGQRMARQAKAEGNRPTYFHKKTDPTNYSQSQERVIAFLKQKTPATPKAIAEGLDVSLSTVNAALRTLFIRCEVTKRKAEPGEYLKKHYRTKPSVYELAGKSK